MVEDVARTKIFVVSLRGATERRRAFEAANASMRDHWQFFDACEKLHPGLRYTDDGAIVAKGRPLTSGEIGCYSSHYNLWEMLARDEGVDQYIILEDDVIVDWTCLLLLMAERHHDAGNDYLRLYYKKPVRARLLQKNFLSRSTWLVELSGYCFGTQAYLLTKEGARRFVEKLNVVSRPVDDAMDRSWAHGIPNRAVFPFPVIEQAVQSSIGSSRFDSFSIPARLKIRRFVARNAERIRFRFGTRRFWR